MVVDPVKTMILQAITEVGKLVPIVGTVRRNQPTPPKRETAEFPAVWIYDDTESKRRRNRYSVNSFGLQVETYFFADNDEASDKADLIDCMIYQALLSDLSIKGPHSVLRGGGPFCFLSTANPTNEGGMENAYRTEHRELLPGKRNSQVRPAGFRRTPDRPSRFGQRTELHDPADHRDAPALFLSGGDQDEGPGGCDPRRRDREVHARRVRGLQPGDGDARGNLRKHRQGADDAAERGTAPVLWLGSGRPKLQRRDPPRPPEAHLGGRVHHGGLGKGRLRGGDSLRRDGPSGFPVFQHRRAGRES